MSAIDTRRTRHHRITIREPIRLQCEKQHNSVQSEIGSGIFVAIVMWFWPGVIPYSYFELWQIHGSAGDWLWTSKWVIAWSIGVTFRISS